MVYSTYGICSVVLYGTERLRIVFVLQYYMVIWYSMYLSIGRENINTKPYTSYRNIVFARINMRKMEEER
jgi:hypothetical protein